MLQAQQPRGGRSGMLALGPTTNFNSSSNSTSGANTSANPASALPPPRLLVDQSLAASSSLSPLSSPRLQGATRQRVHVASQYSDAYFSPPAAPSAPAQPSASYYYGGRMADSEKPATSVEQDEEASGSFLAVAGKHLLRRLTRAAKSANWPVVIAFSSCLIVLLRALSGAGYIPPDSPNPPTFRNPLFESPLPDSVPSRGWTHAWDVWRVVAEDLRKQMMEDREKWVGSVRPERERGRWTTKSFGAAGAAVTAFAGGEEVIPEELLEELLADDSVYIDFPTGEPAVSSDKLAEPEHIGLPSQHVHDGIDRQADQADAHALRPGAQHAEPFSEPLPEPDLPALSEEAHEILAVGQEDAEPSHEDELRGDAEGAEPGQEDALRPLGDDE